jgi:(2Fe-2S) ferredoxin
MSTEQHSDAPASPGKYTKHIMVCVRERKPGHPKGSCGECGGEQIRKDFADLLKSHGLKGPMRASKTHCLDACEMGAVVVVYPDDVWYVNVRREDVPHIFEASVLNDDVYAPRLATEATWQQLADMRAQVKDKKDKKAKKK